MPPILHARLDPTLTARVVRSLPLLYAGGADPALDRPAHVRSASGLVRVDGRIAVIQDDANFVALIDPATGESSSITLPAGEAGLRQFDDIRGNKRFKLDLESCVAVRDHTGAEMLIAFGSGSTGMREKIVTVRAVALDEPDVRIVDASALYSLLRANVDFAGSEMNIEGAVAEAGVLCLFNRGNGAPVDGLLPVNATCDLDLATFLAHVADPTITPPQPRNITQFALGEIDGFALTFTDAALLGDAIFFAAAAEASPDATRDGPVAGCAIGILRDGNAPFAVVQSADGSRYPGKIEGILPDANDPTRLLAVIDRDDPEAPSELLEVVLGGDWT